MGFADVIIGDPSPKSEPEVTTDDLAFDLEFMNDKTLYEEIVMCGMLLTGEGTADCCELVEVQSDAADGGGGGGPWSDLEEVRDWKIRIDATCDRLSIHADPHNWSTDEVLRWCRDTLHELGLPSDPSLVAGLAMDGTTFCMLNEEGFRSRAAQVGETLYSELAIWKSVCHLPSLSESFDFAGCTSFSDSIPVFVDMNAMDLHRCEPASSRDDVMTTSSDDEPHRNLQNPYSSESADDDVTVGGSTQDMLLLGTKNPFFSETSLKSSELQDRNFVSINVAHHHPPPPQHHHHKTPPNYSAPTAPTSKPKLTEFRSWPMNNREKHSNHLWQFLKELLSRPSAFGDCIRWTDRENGVFRIEDSTKVAKLWGERKHRPAMNYDKLSRSIRQYYKKGIIRKTQQSKRLVYQFYPQYI